ncbi:hypothetical protein ACFLTC_02825 [Chloroflexota bacterium]
MGGSLAYSRATRRLGIASTMGRVHDQPTLGQASNIALLALTLLGLVLNFQAMIDQAGSLGILAGIILIVLCLVVGYLLGMASPDSGTHSVVGLGTAQRNILAAQNFDTNVVTYLMVIAVIGLVVLMPAAGEWGKRAKSSSTEAQVHDLRVTRQLLPLLQLERYAAHRNSP